MIDFTKAIESGINEANQVERNFQEIKSVFSELDRQLKSQISEDISLEIESESGLQNFVKFILTQKISETTINGDITLSVSGRSTPVGRWIQDKNGYPFTLRMNNGSVDCWDKESLVQGLTELVSNPGFWLKYKSLVALNEDNRTSADKNNLPLV